MKADVGVVEDRRICLPARLPGAYDAQNDSSQLDTAKVGAVQIINFKSSARVAQLDRVSASEAEGCGFDPRRAHHSTIFAVPSRISCPSLDLPGIRRN